MSLVIVQPAIPACTLLQFLQIIFTITQNQLAIVLPKMFVSAHESTLINRVGSGLQRLSESVGHPRPYHGHTFHQDTDNSVVSSVSDRNRLHLQNRSRQSQQQYGTTHILINAIHWLHRPCSALSQFDRVSKKAVCESRLGHPQPCVWCFKVVQECRQV